MRPSLAQDQYSKHWITGERFQCKTKWFIHEGNQQHEEPLAVKEKTKSSQNPFTMDSRWKVELCAIKFYFDLTEALEV